MSTAVAELTAAQAADVRAGLEKIQGAREGLVTLASLGLEDEEEILAFVRCLGSIANRARRNLERSVAE